MLNALSNPFGIRNAAILAFLGTIVLTFLSARADNIEFFEKKIRPLLVEQCYKCHSTAAGKSKGELLLDSRDNLLKGGENGPSIVPGDPEKSRLIEAVRYSNPDLQMPPKGQRLSAEQVADLVEWVKMGCPTRGRDSLLFRWRDRMTMPPRENCGRLLRRRIRRFPRFSIRTG